MSKNISDRLAKEPATNNNRFTKITLQVHPLCNHPEFVPTCVYCADSKQVIFKILKMQYDTRLNPTKIQIIKAEYREGDDSK